ncbi:MAG: nucleoside hydrolase [Candidatus Brocadiia bacterium]
MTASHEGKHRVPEIPAPDARIPLLIDTDCGCEVDDQFAIALAVHRPDRFDLQGFVATHFADDPGSTVKAAEEIERVLNHCGMEGRWPVRKGGDPLQYSSVPSESEGAGFIVEKAMQHTPEEPLWIAVLGACTNTVSAYLKEPRIAERIVVLYHGRTQFWPEKCSNFNVVGDLKAARVLFTSKLPLVLFDTGTYLRAPVEETERGLAPCGQIGRYLHEIRLRTEHWRSPRKAFYDLGDIAFLVDPSLAYREETDAPSVDNDLRYNWQRTFGRIVRVYQIDRDGTFELLYRTLASA